MKINLWRSTQGFVVAFCFALSIFSNNLKAEDEGFYLEAV